MKIEIKKVVKITYPGGFFIFLLFNFFVKNTLDFSCSHFFLLYNLTFNLNLPLIKVSDPLKYLFYLFMCQKLNCHKKSERVFVVIPIFNLDLKNYIQSIFFKLLNLFLHDHEHEKKKNWIVPAFYKNSSFKVNFSKNVKGEEDKGF